MFSDYLSRTGTWFIQRGDTFGVYQIPAQSLKYVIKEVNIKKKVTVQQPLKKYSKKEKP